MCVYIYAMNTIGRIRYQYFKCSHM